MTPQKIKTESPIQGGGYSEYDRPIATPDMIGGTGHVVPAVIYDTHVHGAERLWDGEDSFLASLKGSVDEVRQQRQAGF